MKPSHVDERFVNNNSLAYTPAACTSTNESYHDAALAKRSGGGNTAHRRRLSNKKLKIQQLRTVANSYLSNIALDGYIDDEVRNEYYEKVMANRFDCFLTFNKISTRADRQSEYFNYYKQRIVNEKRLLSSRAARQQSELEIFLASEFNRSESGVSSVVQADEYISKILESNRIGAAAAVAQQNSKSNMSATIIPAIKIVPSNTFTDETDLKQQTHQQLHQITDLELEYIQSQAADAKLSRVIQQTATSNVTLSSTSSISTQHNNNNKLANSLNSALLSISNKLTAHSGAGGGNKSGKSPLDSLIDQPVGNTNNEELLQGKANAQQRRQQYRRTISESSNESTFQNVMRFQNKNNAGLGATGGGTHQFPYSSVYTTQTNRGVAGYKPSLFGNLRKLNNEKLVFTSNNAPLGMFARLPFRLGSIKSDLNDSFIKTRHLSVNKTGTQHSNFILEVFELLELDFQEYSNTGIMSYSNLIDPVYRLLKPNSNNNKSKTADGDGGQDGERSDDNGDEEKDELGMEIVGKSLFKREMSPFLITAYQPDYLDDPQLTELTAGKNRTCLKFASYSVSIIDYVKPLDLKKEINETFKEKFPYVQITLTKLRSIKRELYEIAQDTGLDFVIVAQAYIYFEKLILQGLINKANRKFLAGDCLILAAKLNDTSKKELNKLIDNIMDKFRFDNRKDLIAYEFAILVALEFNLVIKYETEFVKHYERLQNSIELSLNRGEKHNGRVFNYQKESEK